MALSAACGTRRVRVVQNDRKPHLSPVNVSAEQFSDAAHFAHRRYQLLVGAEYGVRWLPIYNLSDDKPFRPPRAEGAGARIEDLYPENDVLASAENPFEVKYARRRDIMLIEPSIYLEKLIRDFLVEGGRIHVRNFASASELSTLEQNLIFNCTGLGAKALFNDDELTPIKGQLSFLLPQPEIDYCTVGPDDLYMFPRHDGIVLGGSHERGVWSMDPEPEVSRRILEGTLDCSLRLQRSGCETKPALCRSKKHGRNRA